MSKPENREEYLAKKREQAKLWYQNIKKDPELYAEYQRRNRLKYEKRLACKSEMTPTQKSVQRKKWREESKRRYQQRKDKQRQSMAENRPPEGDVDAVHLIETVLIATPENIEELITIKAESEDVNYTEDVLTINMKLEDLGIESFNDNPELNLDDIENCQHPMQRMSPLSKHVEEENSEADFSTLTESEELNINSNTELNERTKTQETNTSIKELSTGMQTIQRKNIGKERQQRYQPKKNKKVKHKPQTREELLAKKRERERLRYHYIKNNPALYTEFKKKQILKYENRKANKKILHISEMTTIQKRNQRKKWREVSKRRYQKIKEKKAREKQSGAENSLPEDASYPVQLLTIRKTKAGNNEKNKVLPISKMPISQQSKQRKKFREERKQKDQIMENKPPEPDIYPVHLIETVLVPNIENIEEVFTAKAQSDDVGVNLELNDDFQKLHENITMQKEHIPNVEMTSRKQKHLMVPIREEIRDSLDTYTYSKEKPKHKNNEEVVAIKIESVHLNYENINDNPELKLDDIGNCQLPMQRASPSSEHEGEENSIEDFSTKSESEELNYNTTLNFFNYERNETQENNTPIIESLTSKQTIQRRNLGEEGNSAYQPKKDKKEKRKPQSREEQLAKKRERERLRYHSIKNNPELYTELKKKQSLKYENRKATKKILNISEMTPTQKRNQRKKWREVSKRRYQKIKEKKGRENNEEVVAMKESIELNYENINDNPELKLDGIGNCQLPIQRASSSEHEGEETSIEDFSIKSESEELNYNTILNFNYERNETQETNTPIIESLTSKQTIQRRNLGEERNSAYQPKKDKKEKRKPQSREEQLAKKRERERLRYHSIKNNPELYTKLKKKQSLKYENRKATKKILNISEMTPTQKRNQRKKWREESKRRYQKIKEKKEREKQSGAENSPPEDGSDPVQLLVIRKTKAVNVIL
ncbi:myb-like protein X [Leguminivora glycinivorella]|uniref:myb-like protein X n=1 Tax=Leguminivora glycinivorella TaxID=1035111 RepID=UPI00200C4820|nr:myb-like protein X [Leguminivora glycinivorella]XP_047986939.1 myb-like protein X [Leguminivora glycinivorella]